MTVRAIVTYPDVRLAVVAHPVTTFDERLRTLAADLSDTLAAVSAIGITAPHIGVAQRVVVLRLPGEVARVFVNPRVEWASDERLRQTEGSISMPGVSEAVERPARVRVAFQDLDGLPHTEAVEGFAAACHQHEIDQLDGIFWIERLSRLKRERAIKRYMKLRRAQGSR